jgi:hypothetical protein
VALPPIQRPRAARSCPSASGSWVSFEKEEVFEICGALALAEVLLARLGRQAEASRMATVFDLVEAGLAR